MNEFIYEPEFVSVEDLCCISKRLEIEINQLQKHIDLFGHDDDDYNAWMTELTNKTYRLDFINRRIRSRQAKNGKHAAVAAASLS
jgi:hypothetical protein